MQDAEIVGQLRVIRDTLFSLSMSLDATLKRYEGNESSELREPAAAECSHPRKVTRQTAGSTKILWFCPDCGAQGERA
jgi:Zn finger protein HypA/HybF involved in hydrogenase expression